VRGLSKRGLVDGSSIHFYGFVQPRMSSSEGPVNSVTLSAGNYFAMQPKGVFAGHPFVPEKPSFWATGLLVACRKDTVTNMAKGIKVFPFRRKVVGRIHDHAQQRRFAIAGYPITIQIVSCVLHGRICD
jgi:hypothetical protein